MVIHAGDTHGLSTEEVQRIEHALAEVEARTSVRLAVVIAEASGGYDRPEDIAGFLIGLMAALLVWIVLPDASLGGDSWAGFTPDRKTFWMVTVLVTGFVGGATLAGRWWVLRRVFTPRLEMRQCVEQAAAATYQSVLFPSRPSDQSATSGLLIYLSLYERRATLLTDATIEQAIGQTTLDTLLRDLTLLLREDETAEAVCQTVRRAAAACGQSFPANLPAPQEKNQLLLV